MSVHPAHEAPDLAAGDRLDSVAKVLLAGVLEVTGFDLALCPACAVGTLVILAQLPAIDVAPCSLRGPPLDSS